MKKFTGTVIFSFPHALLIRKKRTHVYIYRDADDVPLFEKGETVTVESQQHFPITVSRWTDEHRNLVTDRIRGKYYMYYSDNVQVFRGTDA